MACRTLHPTGGVEAPRLRQEVVRRLDGRLERFQLVADVAAVRLPERRHLIFCRLHDLRRRVECVDARPRDAVLLRRDQRVDGAETRGENDQDAHVCASLVSLAVCCGCLSRRRRIAAAKLIVVPSYLVDD